jgi:peptide/nickel transport system substrate-binding protein
MSSPVSGRILVAIVSALCFLSLLLVSSPSGRGQEPAAALPTLDDVLRSTPFDRLTLSDGTVLLVDPVSPRPLPTIEPAKSKHQQKVRTKGSKTEIPLEGNIGLPGEPSKFKMPDQERSEKDDDAARDVKIHLLQEAAVRDFTVKRSSIKSIEYFEDLLLAEANRLVLARDFARGFECILRVKSRNSSWPGIDDHVNRLLFAEGSTALLGGDHERGLRLLRELLTRKRDYPGLLDQLASAYGGWISQALDVRQFSKGRRFLHELEQMAPEHAVVREMRDRFITRARDKVKDDESQSGPGKLDALVDALRIWPAVEGGENLYKQAFAQCPTLDVGVRDVPNPLGPWLRSPADARVSRLLYVPILAADSEDAKHGRVPGQLAGALESSDLGRRLIFRVQPGIPWSDGSRPASAVDVARALIDRTDPNSTKFQARWADLLDRVEAADESRVEVRLNRPLVKLGSWFEWPVGPAHAGIDGRIATVQQNRVPVTSGPFRWASSSDRAIALLRSEDAGAGGSSSSSPTLVRRIREVRFNHSRALIGALMHGEVSLVAHAPPDQLAVLGTNPDIKIGRYSQPLVHMIALDGRNTALRSRSLRRGLSYAIDRRTLLEESVLRRPPSEGNTVADGPFAKGNYADAPGVRPLEYNPSLAMMLVAAARKELGGSAIELKFEYPAIPEAQTVVPVIAEAFRQSGVRIETIERPESQLETELRAGRRFDLAYRALRCEEPVLDAGLLLCPGYDAPPEADALASATSPRILQLLLQLDRAVEVPTARGLAIQIDREARDELPVLPLWQVVDHYAWRTRLKGPADISPRLYQGIETWEIEPWVAKDPWTKP